MIIACINLNVAEQRSRIHTQIFEVESSTVINEKWKELSVHV